MQKILE